MTASQQDRYIAPVPTRVEIDGQLFSVHVHLAVLRGRIACVGIDLHSFFEFDPELHDKVAKLEDPTGDPAVDAALTAVAGWDTPSTAKAETVMLPTNETFVEITSPIVRSLRTSEVIESAVAPMRDLLRKIADDLARLDPRVEPIVNVVEEQWGEGSPPGKRRGPRPQLDDTVLREVVAATYRVAGKRPVQAVRKALEESGALRPPVTIDQARKAVAAARARGFIPPAKRTTGQQGGQP